MNTQLIKEILHSTIRVLIRIKDQLFPPQMPKQIQIKNKKMVHF